MLLITNLKIDDKRLGVAVVKVYLMRWRIDEVCGWQYLMRIFTRQKTGA